MTHQTQASLEVTSTAASSSIDNTDPLAASIKRNRESGWTVRRMRRFLSLFEVTERVGASCAALGLSRRSVTKLRRRNPAFAAEWDAALGRRRAREAEELQALDDIDFDIEETPKAADGSPLSNSELLSRLSHIDNVIARSNRRRVNRMGT